MKLSERLAGFRVDRPSEWLMDEFTRDAEALDSRLEQQAAVIQAASNFFDHYCPYPPGSYHHDAEEWALYNEYKKALQDKGE